jgi:hypothetical protein
VICYACLVHTKESAGEPSGYRTAGVYRDPFELWTIKTGTLLFNPPVHSILILRSNCKSELIGYQTATDDALLDHLIRFIAVEDEKEHLGQLVHTTRDIGEDFLSGVEIFAYRINGSIYDGEVTKEVMRVNQVRTVLASFTVAINDIQILSPISQQVCTYIRTLGLNYSTHVAVGNTA